jgi:acetyl esterase/lipase
MTKRKPARLADILIALSMLVLAATPSLAADPSAEDWASIVGNEYAVEANITYQVANQYENKLDLYLPRHADKPVPTVIYIHGGGWVGGTKEGVVLRLLPFMKLGMAVVNVEYRLARVSLAPAAVADCRCALRWVLDHAEQYKFDTSRLVVTGGSAGGHLALTTGMLDPAAGLDSECPAGGAAADRPMKVAAIVNYYGITDVADLLSGPNQKTYAVRWLGSLPNAVEVAKRVSPLLYVRKDLPPILTIHGDADPTVPYQHAVRLHEALDKAKVPNELLTIPGGKHGGFTNEETLKIQKTIDEFLTKYGILTGTS